jgi:hypothetical protein
VVTKPLWQLVLDWIEESYGDRATHQSDRASVIAALKGCWEVGERPDYADVKAYATTLWATQHPYTCQTVLRTCRTLERNPLHRFRLLRDREPLYTVDRLAEEYGLERTEDRLGEVVQAAARHLSASQVGEPAKYQLAQRELEAAVDAIHRLRRLRIGRVGLGEDAPDHWHDSRTTRPRWW